MYYSYNTCIYKSYSTEWRAFWANIGRPCFNKFGIKLKLHRLKSLVFPILNFRISRWPFSHRWGNLLDRTQRAMIARCLNLKCSTDESFDAFSRRKNRVICQCITPENRWSYVWCTRITTWHAHVMRNTNSSCLSSRIVEIRSPSELEARRRDNNNRPAVRCFSGFSSTRWYDCVPVAQAYVASV